MASPSTIPLSGFSKPSEDEQRTYFSGLTGCPRLVARTSTTPWVIYDTHHTEKTLSTLGCHSIVKKWNPGLRSHIVHVLTNGVDNSDNTDNMDNDASNDSTKGIDWDVFFPIRVGNSDHSDTSKYPAVLLVTMPPDARPCTWETAMHVALGCRKILHTYGVLDIEVEIMRSQFVPMASPASAELASCVDWSYSQIPSDSFDRDLALAKVNAHIMPLLPFPGCRIEQPEARPGEPEAEAGTLGLFVRLRDEGIASKAPESKQGQEPMSTPLGVYGLTNRHVAVGLRLAGDCDVWHHDRNDSGKDINTLRMLTGGFSAVRDVSSLLAYHQIEVEMEFRGIQRSHLSDPDNASKGNSYKTYSGCLEYMECMREKLGTIEDMDASKRQVGEVAYSPRFSISDHGHFRDWALVNMSHTATINAQNPNRVYLAEPVTKAAIVRAINFTANRKQRLIFEEPHLDKDGFLRLHGLNIPAMPFDTHTAHLVAKRGQKTGLRYGITNEIEAVRRTPKGADGSLVSYQLLVLGFEGGAFSQPGDSGSCVFDCMGRAMGVLDGGQQANDVVQYMKKFDAHDDGHGPLHLSDVPNQDPLPEGFRPLTTDTGPGMGKMREMAQSDVTFVTPIQWVLDDIRKFTGRDVEIL